MSQANDKIKANGDEVTDNIENEASEYASRFDDKRNYIAARLGYIAGRTKSIEEDKKKDEKIRELEEEVRILKGILKSELLDDNHD